VYNKKILEDRAKMFQKIRSFFSKKKILEVDCPVICKKPSIDLQIEPMQTKVLKNEIGFLHTSPEYLMKRLISKGIGDIYQLSHVFRKGEFGEKHNPEFTLLEWYRKNTSYKKFLEEVLELLSLFFKKKFSSSKKTYRETFFEYTKIDYVKASKKVLCNFIKKNINFNSSLKNLDKDTLLNLILSTYIEPNLGKENFFILDEYPETQAALAKIKVKKDVKVAKRFEIFFKGFELANGYHELTNYKEQKKRFLDINKEREKRKKEKLPLDEKFLNSLKKGLGNYYGVAVGFDRLMMLRHKKNSIKEILPFSWEET
jgi:lysyl-tRNA synthetase class 2